MTQPRAGRRPLSALTWLAWVTSGTLVALGARNPLVGALLLALGVAAMALTRIPGILARLRLALFFPLAGALFNAAYTHVGDTVLLHLPEAWPVVGGSITAEALAYGATGGLAIGALLLWFGVFVSRARAYDLARLAPRAFESVALVVVIALGMAPLARRRLDEIRAAQATRGLQPRGLRDALPLWTPLLAGGLEQGAQLAEAMLARGFVSARRPGSRVAALGVGFGLLIAAAGGLGQLLFPGALPVMLLVAGAAVFALSALAMPRPTTTRYRNAPFTARDGLLTTVVLGATALLLAGVGGRLAWDPYPTLTWPDLPGLAGPALLALVLPPLVERS